MKQVQIAVLDSSCIICEGLQAVFSRLNEVKRVSQTFSFDELENLLQRANCQIVVLNPSYLLSHYNEYLQLRNRYEYTKWIGVVYAHYSTEILSKLDGTIDVYDAHKTIAGKLLKCLETNSDESAALNKDALTDRETDVLKLLAEGKSNKEIADKLNISINTVITHRKNISQKTGIKSVSGLTIYAVVQNLISLDNY